MLKSLISIKNETPRIFQVLLLDNDDSQDVEVQEAGHVDFARVENHLAHGGSVFITSKNPQKIAPPRDKKPHRNKTTRRVTAFYFDRL